MKPSIIFTAAALMTAGIISFVQFSTSDSSTQNAMQVAEATQSQPAVGASSEPGKVMPTNTEEKKTAPIAENKPAATIPDAAHSTGNTVSNQVKGVITDTTKPMTQAVPTPTPIPAPTPAPAK
jgi:type II secretory pathway pseudopilin PulG